MLLPPFNLERKRSTRAGRITIQTTIYNNQMITINPLNQDWSIETSSLDPAHTLRRSDYQCFLFNRGLSIDTAFSGTGDILQISIYQFRLVDVEHLEYCLVCFVEVDLVNLFLHLLPACDDLFGNAWPVESIMTDHLFCAAVYMHWQ